MDEALIARLSKLNRRQLAKFLDYLRDRGRLDGALESDIKRAFRFYHQDVETIVKTTDKENTHANH